jgi:hypothetical protein
MKTKQNPIVNATEGIFVLIVVVLMLIFGGCKKIDPTDNPPVPPVKEVGTISFAPTLNGEVVPWLKKSDKESKQFSTFVHKYFNHVIRIYNPAGVRVIDIPITQTLTGTYSYDLPIGTGYKAEVLPILEDVATAPGTYTFLDLVNNVNTALNKAAFYTRVPISFNVAAATVTPVSLTCITDFASFELDLGGDTYTTLGLPIPEVWGLTDAAFLTAHNVTGLEEATWTQLKAVTDVTGRYKMSPTGGTVLSPSLTAKKGILDYDGTSKIYYLYRIPGGPANINLPKGDGTNQTNVKQLSASYFAFNLTGTPDPGKPTKWMGDYYDHDGSIARFWGSGTCLRISFATGGRITITQSDWFSTIVTPIIL